MCNPILNLLLLAGDIESNPGPTHGEIKVLQINARSIKRVDYLKNKIVQFKTLVALKNPDVISVAETWLNDTVPSDKLLDENEYNIYRKDRADVNGGGVLVAVRKCLNSKQRDDLESPSVFHNEMIIVELKQRAGNTLGILSFYRPPDDLNFEFAQNMRHNLNAMWNNGLQEMLVCGDLNFAEIDWETGYPTNINGLAYATADLFQDFGLSQYNDHPSREENDNILDIILVNHDENLSEITAYMDILDTDHFVLEFNYQVDCVSEATRARVVYNTRNLDFNALNADFERANFFQNANSINESAVSWTSTVLDIINSRVPKRKIRAANPNPWIDGEIRHMSNLKETAWRKWKRTNMVTDKEHYKTANRALRNAVEYKHKQYINLCSDEINANPQRFWNLVGSKMRSKSYPPDMIMDNSPASTPLEKAELFNEFFSSVFTRPTDTPTLPFITTHENPALANLHITEASVEKVLKELDSNKAVGPDGIPTIILKECRQSLVSSITRLFNESLSSGIFPDCWKSANICPVFKKGARRNIRNYRPISLLSVLSKCFEKCVYNLIIDHIKPQIHPLQHGFMSGRSTATQLLIVYDEISRNVDNRGQVDVVFLDLAKAFDSVPHRLLLHKLKHYGIHGHLLNRITSYLTSRKQRTVIDGQLSDEADVLSGVPQGSILGPLLFLMYIDDMSDAIDRQVCKLALYADDAKLYKNINDYNDCLELQRQLMKIDVWSGIWQLNFNCLKCKSMRITRKISPVRFIYALGNTALENVSSFTDLGVIVQDNLAWDMQIASMVKKANRNLWIVRRTVGPAAPTTAKKTLYMSLVRSCLEYCSIIWTHITKENLKRLESVQRRGTKFILSTGWEGPSYTERLSTCALLPLSLRREILDCQFLLKAKSGVFGEDVRFLVDVRPHWRNPRLDAHTSKLRYLPAHTETYSHFYTRRVPHIWNKLPDHVRAIPYTPLSSRFKKALKKFFTNKLLVEFKTENTCTWVSKCRCTTCRQ